MSEVLTSAVIKAQCFGCQEWNGSCCNLADTSDCKMEQSYSFMDLVTKLLGDVTPVGDTEIDDNAHKNLAKHLRLTENLVDLLIEVSSYRKSPYLSCRVLGEDAYIFLQYLYELIGGELSV